jgi:hypothetical protein
VPEFEAACIQVSAPGETPQMIAFQPYQVYITRSLAKSDCIEAEVVLTRRNTFGPLHQVPLKAGAYGPGNFLTEGPGFSEAYRLYPSGLLDEPELLWSL